MKIERILFPTDFSESSLTAQTRACELADQFGAELHVLHVISDLIMQMPQTAAAFMIPPKVMEDVISSAEQELEKLPPAAWVTGKRVVRSVRIGSTFDSIVRYADEFGIDLIVIGTHGRTGLPHMLLGSVAERVVRHAHCSVLTVRPQMMKLEKSAPECCTVPGAVPA